ncbi:retrovirus-related pol polyprotein from transposon TNT 1-94 [Tanacetum coccineum]
MDKNGVVIRNKARLVDQGYRQEEEIDYDETFAPISRLEAIKIFLAYAAYMGFMVHQMDAKSAYEEVYVKKPHRFESSEFPNYVCKLDKALYGSKKHVVKRIFKNLKGAPSLGLWKSNSRGCQILSGKLVCWSVKKQNSMAMSSAKAEYVAAAGAIAISKNPVLHSRTQHTDIRFHFVRDHILKGDIELHFVPTDLQLADVFTKPLAEPSFIRLVAELAYYIEYLGEFWYSTEVDTTSNTITFALSCSKKSLSFDLGDFSTITGLNYSENYTNLPPKETVKDALATLRLIDEKNPQISSIDLINKFLVRIVFFSMI